MKLPEPAGALWKAYGTTILRLAAAEDPPTRVMIQGGTILAARLGHRRSSDIDILVPDVETLDRWMPGGDLDAAAATGGTLTGRRRDRIRVAIEDGGTIDISSTPPKIPGLETLTRIDGENVRVLSNAQILAGKLYRTEQKVARDAFDIVKADLLDPDSLETAVNTLPNEDALNVRRNLYGANDAIAREAAEKVEPTDPSDRRLFTGLGRSASFSVSAHRYRELQIEIGRGQFTVQTSTRAKSEITRLHAGSDVLAITATAAVLGNGDNGISPERASRLIQQCIRNGWEGTLFDSRDPKPAERTTRTAQEIGYDVHHPTELKTEHRNTSAPRKGPARS